MICSILILQLFLYKREFIECYKKCLNFYSVILKLLKLESLEKNDCQLKVEGQLLPLLCVSFHLLKYLYCSLCYRPFPLPILISAPFLHPRLTDGKDGCQIWSSSQWIMNGVIFCTRKYAEYFRLEETSSKVLNHRQLQNIQLTIPSRQLDRWVYI